MIDLDAYFARIGYRGPREPTLAALSRIVLAHVQAIPFENLDVLLGRPIDLTPDALERKLVHSRRGGYCFEQNGFLLLVLESMGFDVRPLSARVRYQRPRDYIPPRTHLFARVEIEGEAWLADVGVGGVSPTAPLRLLRIGERQDTPHEPRRIVREEGRFFHQVYFGQDWHDVYEFTLEEMPPIDREVANWFTSAHPQSHFKSRLVVARAFPEGRVTLVNRELTRRAHDGTSSHRWLANPRELIEVLATEFGLYFEPETKFACPGLDWSVQG